MKILIIDDGRVIHGLEEHDVTYARRVSSGRRELFDNGPWDVVYLDHDMGMDFNAAGELDTETIRPLVLEMEAAAFSGTKPEIGQVVIITDNPGGRRWIADTLAGIYSLAQDRPLATFDYDAQMEERNR